LGGVAFLRSWRWGFPQRHGSLCANQQAPSVPFPLSSQLDQGENHGNCKKSSGKKSCSSEKGRTGQKSGSS
jgi:hypothetical protein